MTQEISDRLDRYSAAWAGIATDGIANFWWADNFRFYKAEEITEILTDWPSVLKYWRGNENLHSGVELNFRGLLDYDIPGPARLITAKMDWRITFRDDAVDSEGRPFRHAGKSMGGWNHVFSLWEEFRDEWHLTGWCEAPDAAPIYLSELYYRAAESNE